MEEIDLDATFDDDDADTVSDDIVETMEEGDGISDSLDENDLNDANMLLEDDDDEPELSLDLDDDSSLMDFDDSDFKGACR